MHQHLQRQLARFVHALVMPCDNTNITVIVAFATARRTLSEYIYAAMINQCYGIARTCACRPLTWVSCSTA